MILSVCVRIFRCVNEYMIFSFIYQTHNFPSGVNLVDYVDTGWELIKYTMKCIVLMLWSVCEF